MDRKQVAAFNRILQNGATVTATWILTDLTPYLKRIIGVKTVQGVVKVKCMNGTWWNSPDCVKSDNFTFQTNEYAEYAQRRDRRLADSRVSSWINSY